MRKVTALTAAAAATLALAAVAAPAHAADGTTTVALTVEDGTLAITTTPAAAGVSSSLVGTSRVIVSPLGLTTITDTRAASTGWNLTARTTDFTNSTTAATIAAANASFYVDAAPTRVLGTVQYTYTPSSAPSSGQLAKASASGVSTTELTPVLKVAVPNDAGTGLYAGTVTQSVV